jgi:hypothetical protein
MRRALVLAITVATAARAAAHVAPSVDDNNRYLKLTPLGDRVRLAYTVFFGEVPGARLRRTIDTNRDGTISEPEAQVFGTKLAGEVLAALDAQLDGASRPIVWAEVAVGMGLPDVRNGSFSVDLVAYLCLPTAGGHHTLHLRDRFHLVNPGETEVKIEDSPGITIEHARVGTADDPAHDYKFVGPGGPIADDGIDLAFDVSDKAPPSDGTCVAAAPAGAPARNLSTGLVVGAAAVLGFVLACVVVLVQRRRRTTRKNS